MNTFLYYGSKDTAQSPSTIPPYETIPFSDMDSYRDEHELFYRTNTITNAPFKKNTLLSPSLPEYPKSSSELSTLASVDDFQSNATGAGLSQHALSIQPGLAGLGILLDGLLSSLDSEQILEHECSKTDTVVAPVVQERLDDFTMVDCSPQDFVPPRLSPQICDTPWTPILTKHSGPGGVFLPPMVFPNRRPSMSNKTGDPFSTPITEPPIGIFPDINMHTFLVDEEPLVCVNPADITGPVPTAPDVPMDEQLDSPEENSLADDELEPPASAHTTPVPAWPVSLQLTEEPLDLTQSGQSVHDLLAESFVKLEAIAQEAALRSERPPTPVALDPTLLQLPPMLQSFNVKVEANMTVTHPPVQWTFPPPSGPILDNAGHYRPIGELSPNTSSQPRFCIPNSPVLNAHLGVDVETLRDKVERYKLRYPGHDMEGTWFFPYVGKLSERGELLEDYRCYVKGCHQRNKRRDHIVTHVGSHVDHRPYECSHCGQRFLRRNECRRHESRHALDFKAFKCDMCPEDESKSYSRQDTLKRHMTKAHGFPMSVQGQENSKRRRRRAKAEDSVAGSGRWVKMEGY